MSNQTQTNEEPTTTGSNAAPAAPLVTEEIPVIGATHTVAPEGEQVKVVTAEDLEVLTGTAPDTDTAVSDGQAQPNERRMASLKAQRRWYVRRTENGTALVDTDPKDGSQALDLSDEAMAEIEEALNR